MCFFHVCLKELVNNVGVFCSYSRITRTEKVITRRVFDRKSMGSREGVNTAVSIMFGSLFLPFSTLQTET